MSIMRQNIPQFSAKYYFDTEFQEKTASKGTAVLTLNTPTDGILFSASKTKAQNVYQTLDYQAIDPLMSNEMAEKYRQAELQWYSIMKEVPHNDVDGLIEKINSLGAVNVIKSRKIVKKTAKNARAFVQGRSTTGHILLAYDRKYPKKRTFSVLGHELMHVLHKLMTGLGNPEDITETTEKPVKETAIKPPPIQKTINLIYDALYNKAKYDRLNNRPIAKLLAKTIYHPSIIQDEKFYPALQAMLKEFSGQELVTIKQSFISETVAYHVQSTIEKPYRPEESKQHWISQSFANAVKLINDELAERYLESDEALKTASKVL